MRESPDQQPSKLTDNDAAHEPTSGTRATRKVFKFLGLGLLVCFLLLESSGPQVEAVLRVATGWMWFLASSSSQMEASGAETGLFVGLLIATIVCGFVLIVSIRNRDAVARPGLIRSIRLSSMLVGVIVLIFVAGISFVGLSRNVIWLARTKGSLVESGRANSRRTQSKNNLKQIGLSLWNYHEVADQFPPGGTFNEMGEGQHGWITLLLPFMDYADLHAKIDMHDHWKSEANADHMKTPIPFLLHPGLPWESTKVSGGFAATHYAGNPWILAPNQSLSLRDITDGASNTILAGEIKDAIPAWGSPGNWRKIDRKLNSPAAFGSPSMGVVQFLLGDGTVRAISEQVDPVVLKALFTPSDGRQLGDF
ncbi:MAG: DUF1559 domain-containing protein [Planctomycetota bacterium]|nr:DUF1559 domain-containing protein [Planctomycetota bacterium]